MPRISRKNKCFWPESRTAGKRLLLLLLLLAMCLLPASLMAGCDKSMDSEFPTLETSKTTETANPLGTETKANGQEPVKTLRVALPVGQDALDAIRRLYRAKRSGLLNQEPGQYIGQEIQLADLQKFESSLTIILEPVSVSTGATKEQIAAWRAAGTMPDIIYSRDAATTLGLDQVVDLNSFLYNNSLLSANHVYASILESCRQDQTLMGIPYLASVPLLYFNQTLLDQFQIAQPPLNWTWQEWQNASIQIQDKINAAGYGATPQTLQNLSKNESGLSAQLQKSIFVTEDTSDLLAFLPASLNISAGWAMWHKKSFQFSDTAFQTSYKWLNQYTRQGFTPLHLSFSQEQTAFGGKTALQAGRVVMWTGDSSEMARLHQQTGFKVTESFIPCSPVTASDNVQALSLLSMRTPVEVRSLYISKTCADPALAAELAAFIALDADSLLLQSRFQLFEGFIPLIQDKVVWENIVSRQLYGKRLQTLQTKLPYAYCSGQQLMKDWQNILQASIGTYGRQLLTAANETAQSDILKKLIQAAPGAALEGS